jgi:hypothetical protein
MLALVGLTDEGMRQLENFGDTVAKIREAVTGFGGTLEHVWQSGGNL